MAKFSCGGVDELTAYLKSTGELTGNMATEMLQAGAKVLVDVWKHVITVRGHIRTRAMVDSVRPTKVRKSTTGQSVEVYPQGKDKTTGVRNAEKAFLIHYGWQSNGIGKASLGDHFVDEVKLTAEDNVANAMEEQMQRYIERHQ